MEKISFINCNNFVIIMVVVINFFEGFDKDKIYFVIIVLYSGGGVKEQIVGIYVVQLVVKGFVIIVFDCLYQGESGGMLCQLENFYVSIEDVSVVIDYMIMLFYVDNNCIGVMGICVGVGYMVNVVIQDCWIKVIGMVSVVNIGLMFCNGWENIVKFVEVLLLIQVGFDVCIMDVLVESYVIMLLVLLKEVDVLNEELCQVWEYYYMLCVECVIVLGVVMLCSFSQIIIYDVYYMVDVYLIQLIQIIVGSEVGLKWMSEDLYDCVVSIDKYLYIVKGVNYMQFYDGDIYVVEVVFVFVLFFMLKLGVEGDMFCKFVLFLKG